MKKFSILYILLCLCSQTVLGQANTDLSNLVLITAINSGLTPAVDNTIDLGSPAKSFRDLHLDGTFFLNGINCRIASGGLGFFEMNNSTNANGTNGLFALGIGAGVNTTGTFNTFIGNNAGNANTTGFHNMAIGFDAYKSNTGGTVNMFIGNSSGSLALNCLNNVCIGFETGKNFNVANNNVVVGANAASSMGSAGSNVIVGKSAASALTSGNNNTLIGASAGAAATSSTSNVCVGAFAGTGLSTGTNNTFIGSGTDCTTQGALTNSSAIGNGASIRISNGMAFGNASVVRWGFGNSLASVATTKAFVVGLNATNGNAAFLTNGGVWTNASTRELKEDFASLDKQTILERVNQLDITKWKYIGTEEYHIGPMAEQFYELFEVGVDNKSISTMDPAGVALVSIQALSENADERKEKLSALQKNNEELKMKMEALEQCVLELCEMKKSVSIQSENQASILAIMPNPASASAYVELTIPQNNSQVNLRVFDTAGALVLDKSIQGTGNVRVELNIGSLAAGNYSCVLFSNGAALGHQTLVVAK